jgi:hypothetical protein
MRPTRVHIAARRFGGVAAWLLPKAKAARPDVPNAWFPHRHTL